MSLTDAQLYKRAAKRQLYEDFRKYAKAPSFRRLLAALIDLSIVSIPAVYGFLKTGSYLCGAPMMVYFLLRDWLFGARSLGKLIMGLVVVHFETFAPCTLRQSLIRNALYAVIGPVLLFVGLAYLGLGGMVLSFAAFLVLASQASTILSIGYDPDTGRTIPDSWAETHVLKPSEIAKILKMKAELDQMP